MNENIKKKEPNFWVRGKRETKNFYAIELLPGVNIKSFLFGLLVAAVLILPLGIMIFQYLIIYGYLGVFRIYLLLIWVSLLLFNGLSNYFTVKIAQVYDPNNHRLQSVNAKYVFFYNCLSIGFAIFTLLVIIFLGLVVFV
ncbi:MAG: hypothetical protein M0R05_05470 [Bacilli bacterium]|nr:hypothetical protein [Bacilli bacterium]MDD4388095.1 hypothetical protein [Bacilli bacterium]